MKFSSKVEKCGLSPMRKFHPYAVAAKARGVNIYHSTSASLTYRLLRVFRGGPSLRAAGAGLRALARYPELIERDPELL